jgi:hypothetical protein
MASAALDITKYVLGIAAYAPDWRIALYGAGGNPITDLAGAEIDDSRTVLPTMIASTTNAGYVTNAVEFDVGPLDSVSVGGWFLVNGATEDDVAWVGAFATPLTISTGDYVKFAAGSVLVRIA